MKGAGLQGALVGLGLLALWGIGGMLVFLVGPVVSRFPPLWGGLAGMAAFLLQILLGGTLLRSLLRLRPDPPEGRGLTAWLDEERPFLLALGKGPDLVATRGLLEGPPEDLDELVAELRPARSGLPGTLLTGVLALPCLFRAFESAVQEYGRLRGGAGPLWYLGRALRALSGLLEAPLRLMEPAPPEPGQGARRRLHEALVATTRFPAWMEALDLLSPVSLVQVRREARIRALLGSSTGARAGAPIRLDLLGRLAPWTGLLAGLVLAWLPGGPLAAPLVLTALGLGIRLHRTLPLAPPRQEVLEDLWVQARASGRGVPVRLRGELVGPPEGLAVRDGTWLEVDNGRIELLEAPKGGGVVEITGWILPEGPSLLVGTLREAGVLRRSFPILRRLVLPLALAITGGAWWFLQVVGL